MSPFHSCRIARDSFAKRLETVVHDRQLRVMSARRPTSRILAAKQPFATCGTLRALLASYAHPYMKAVRQSTSHIVLLSLLLITACVTDKSSDARLSAAMHRCFRTTDDAVLYQTNKCPPLSGSDTSTCTTLKYLNSFAPPANRGLLVATPKVNSLGAVTRGTSFTIEAMRRFSHPEQGSIWITTAQIRDGEFTGQMITLPWDDLSLEFHGDGGWIKDFVQREPFVRDPYRPQIDYSKMVPCETSVKSE
jgi:hypothetical protein